MLQKTDTEPPKEPQSGGALRISVPVFGISALLTVAFVIFGVGFPEVAERAFSATLGFILDTVGWFYSLAVGIFLVFVIWMALARFGRMKLGPDDAEPEFGFVSWFAMLFSAGMGIGLMFFGVAEPMMHYANPPVGEGGTVDAAREAMRITFFHWGLHAWAIYIVVGLAIAYFSFRHGLPLSIRSALYPIIGERIHGPIGHAVDIFAVMGTLFGVATSLGIGVMQVNAGLNYLFPGIEISTNVQLMLIAGITGLATISVVSGLGRGIRRLSELNILLALGLLVFVIAAGPTVFLFQATLQNAGSYLGNIVPMTFNQYAYEPTDWIGDWTLFYWGWWIAWSPFVGMFIARVSYGRTIREFVIGVLAVPAIVTFLWFTAFGNTAIFLDGGTAAGAIGEAIATTGSETAIFAFFEQLPFAAITSLIATFLVVTFFVTSSDSGSLVIDMITSGGDADPPVWSRVFWAVTEGVVATALLLAGGLAALQTAAIASALPFAVIMLFICYGLAKGLRLESAVPRRARVAPLTLVGVNMPWQQRLAGILNFPDRKRADRFLAETARPALEKVCAEIEQAGYDVEVTEAPGDLRLAVSHGQEPDFIYGIALHSYPRPAFALTEFRPKQESDVYYRAEVYLLDGPQHYDVMGYTETQLIQDVLTQYDTHMNVLQLTGAQGEPVGPPHDESVGT